MSSTVWFTDLSARPGNSLIDKTGALLRAAGIRERTGRGTLTAVKLHFGEKGNTAFIRPIFVRKVVEEIKAGDVIWCPPGVKHWHGASPATAMTHIALTGTLNGRNVEWMEKVTDEQYNGK